MYGFILDLDGTIYRGKEVIPGALDFVLELRRRGWPYVYGTNNSSRTPQAVAEQLASFGLPFEPQRVITTARLAADYAAAHFANQRIAVIGENGIFEALHDAGLVGVPILAEEAAGAKVLVQGVDREFTYAKLAAAIQLLKQQGSQYILTNPDLVMPTDVGIMPGAGAIGASIREASGANPIVLGKPARAMIDWSVKFMGLPHEQIWMIGDNPATDIAAGITGQCHTALVLTGLVSREALQSSPEVLGGHKPDRIADDLPALLAQFEC